MSQINARTFALFAAGCAQDKATQAENAARGVSGVQSVKNDLQVKSAASGR